MEAFTRDLIGNLAPGGGYILAPCHTLPEDVKPENVVAFLDTARRVGRYPIQPAEVQAKREEQS